MSRGLGVRVASFVVHCQQVEMSWNVNPPHLGFLNEFLKVRIVRGFVLDESLTSRNPVNEVIAQRMGPGPLFQGSWSLQAALQPSAMFVSELFGLGPKTREVYEILLCLWKVQGAQKTSNQLPPNCWFGG